jgi:hypothetical protein
VVGRPLRCLEKKHYHEDCSLEARVFAFMPKRSNESTLLPVFLDNNSLS